MTNIPFEDLEENQEEIKKIIKHLRSLIETEKFLNVRKDDNFLLRYLRSSQYSPELAFRKMKTYYSLKRINPQWYLTDESVAPLESDINNMYYLLEDRDRFGRRIYINKLGMIDTSKTTMTKQSQIQDLFLEYVLDEEETQKNGILVIVDLKNFSWTLLKWLTPTNVCIAVKKIESLPVIKIEFHVINMTALLNAAIKLIWPFLSEKTKENIYFHHEDWQTLHSIIEPECLPECYGGTKSFMNIDKLLHYIYKSGKKERFSENLKLGYVKDSET